MYISISEGCFYEIWDKQTTAVTVKYFHKTASVYLISGYCQDIKRYSIFLNDSGFQLQTSINITDVMMFVNFFNQDNKQFKPKRN